MEYRIFLDISIGGSILTGLFALTLLISNLKRQLSYLKWLALWLLLFFTSETGGVLSFVLDGNPNVFGNAYSILCILPLSIFFYRLIAWESFCIPIMIVAGLYTTFSIGNILLIQKNDINSYSSVAEAFIILVFSIAYFYKLLKELPTQQLQRLPLFWIISALFFSYAGKLAIYAVSHYLVHIVQDNLIFVWSFHNFLSIICNLVIAYGTWLNVRQLQSIPS
jgi:hypothetical protein